MLSELFSRFTQGTNVNENTTIKKQWTSGPSIFDELSKEQIKAMMPLKPDLKKLKARKPLKQRPRV